MFFNDWKVVFIKRFCIYYKKQHSRKNIVHEKKEKREKRKRKEAGKKNRKQKYIEGRNIYFHAMKS